MIAPENSVIADHGAVASTPEKRHALYYPYIHIRDETWLKGAILAFQQVRRIIPALSDVPGGFGVKDAAITRPYSTLIGPAGPLLRPADYGSPKIAETEKWLSDKVNERLPELKAKYSKGETYRTINVDPDDAFQIHAGKFHRLDFVAMLKREELAWHIRNPNDPDSINWLAMHPKFGSAMMSVLAIAVARAGGLSVVTPSGRTHHELLANREEEVFDKLVEVSHPGGDTSDPGATVEELTHVVITTGFDLTRLTPEDILELLKEGKDLRAFRETVARYATSVPSGLDEDERKRRLKQEAEAVLDEWRKYTGALPQFAKEAIVDTVLDKGPDKLIEAGLAGAVAGTAATVVGVIPGLAITIVVAAGIKMFRKRDTPLRFLTKVNDTAGKRIGSIYCPQWRALAAQSA